MTVAPDALARLQAHDWPGNIRELRNLAERIAVLGPAESPLAALTRPLLLRCAPEMFVVAASDSVPLAAATLQASGPALSSAPGESEQALPRRPSVYTPATRCCARTRPVPAKSSSRRSKRWARRKSRSRRSSCA